MDNQTTVTIIQLWYEQKCYCDVIVSIPFQWAWGTNACFLFWCVRAVKSMKAEVWRLSSIDRVILLGRFFFLFNERSWNVRPRWSTDGLHIDDVSIRCTRSAALSLSFPSDTTLPTKYDTICRRPCSSYNPAGHGTDSVRRSCPTASASAHWPSLCGSLSSRSPDSTALRCTPTRVFSRTSWCSCSFSRSRSRPTTATISHAELPGRTFYWRARLHQTLPSPSLSATMPVFDTTASSSSTDHHSHCHPGTRCGPACISNHGIRARYLSSRANLHRASTGGTWIDRVSPLCALHAFACRLGLRGENDKSRRSCSISNATADDTTVRPDPKFATRPTIFILNIVFLVVSCSSVLF